MDLISVDGVTVPDTDVHNNYALTVGLRAHMIAARVMREGVEPDSVDRIQQVLRHAMQVDQDHPVARRGQAARFDATTVANTYLLRFANPPGWEFAGAEVQLGGGRADLVYHHPEADQWLVDELKTGRGRTNEVHLRPQIDRYLQGGAETWGDSFVGVRLCAVRQPLASRLYLSGRKRSILLADSLLAESVSL